MGPKTFCSGLQKSSKFFSFLQKCIFHLYTQQIPKCYNCDDIFLKNIISYYTALSMPKQLTCITIKKPKNPFLIKLAENPIRPSKKNIRFRIVF